MEKSATETDLSARQGGAARSPERPLTRAASDGAESKRPLPLVGLSTPNFRSSAPSTPDSAFDKKRSTATARFLSKDKLLGPGTPTNNRKRGGSALKQNAPNGPSTPQMKPRKPLASTSTSSLGDTNGDHDFRAMGSSRRISQTNPTEPSTPSSTNQQRNAILNPLTADSRSQWGQNDRLDDWVKKITGPTDSSMRHERQSSSSSSSSDDSSSSGESSDDDAEDEEEQDSSDSSSSSSDTSSNTSVIDIDSKDSRMRFLEEDEDLFSASESGSRMSKAQPALTPDMVRHRAARDLEVIASLVPARVLYAHASGERPRGKQLKPMREEFDGAVLFADISGFSRLAEALVRRGTPSGAAESLTKYVGWNLHEMVEVICSRGGDVMKFAGDAILAVFPADQFDGSLPKAAVCCAQAALALQKLELYAGDVKLCVHSGMGVGRVATYEVGGLQDRWEVFVAGPPVTQIGKCEPQAKAGELVVSAEARQCIEQLTKIEGDMVDDGNFRLDKILQPIEFKERQSAAKELSRLAEEDPDKAVELKRALQKYLSRPVIFSIESHGSTLWGAELRVCSTIFVKFKGLQFNEQSEEDLALVQYVVKNVVQKVMASLEGTVCRFMVDDKGAAMLLAFGLIPFCHADDSARAVKAALAIRDGVAALSLNKPDLKRSVLPPLASSSLKKAKKGKDNIIDDVSSHDVSSTSSPNKTSKRRLSSRYNIVSTDPSLSRTILHREYTPAPSAPVSCQIGITRGKVCVGMVGGSTRCEYTLHGVLVNRAARLMGNATDGVILCDHETYHEAQNEVKFDPNPVVLRLKGERREVKVFKPLSKTSQVRQRHAIGNGMEQNAEDDGFVGRQKQREETEEIFKSLADENPWSGVIGIRGDSGVGKSRMLQHVARVAKRYRTAVLWGFALDTEASTPFFAWKNILIQLLSLVAQNRPTLAGPIVQNAMQVGSAKEGLISAFGSSQSFTASSSGYSPKARKNRSNRIPPMTLSSNNSAKPETVSNPKMPAPTSSPTAVVLQGQTSSSGNGSAGNKRSFEEMTPDERKECLLEALPLDKREMYPLLAPLLDEAISPALLADNEATTSIARNQRAAVTIETVVAMISYFVSRLQQRRERLCIIMEDVQWMDPVSVGLLLQVADQVQRYAIFVSGTFSDEDGLARKIPICTTTWTLRGLEKHEIARCMKSWLHVSKISEAAVNMIFEKSNGNPLFSEELCRLMTENHHFEIANDVCVLSNTGASGETRMNLPNSIIALMTASLDRLDASQQVVLRVVAVMGMQFTLHDLAGVLRAINTASSASKAIVGGSGAKPGLSTVKFDINAEEMTLEQMLKEGAPSNNSSAIPATPPQSSTRNSLNVSSSSTASSSESRKPKSNSAGSEGDIDTLNTSTATSKHAPERVTIRINVVQVLESLVEKGILDERPGYQGARRTFVFRHAMMKETACDELLPEESKRSLHQIIGEYYEERPGSDIEQWHATLAEHFYAAGDYVKARKYLELAGEGAVQNHAVQQVFQFYSRLIKIAQNEDVPRLTRAQWSRKVGEALFHMDRFLQAEEYLHACLEVLQLDCRDAPAMTSMESGFFPKPTTSQRWLSAMGCIPGNLIAPEETVVLRSRPSRFTRTLWGTCGADLDYDDEYAEDFERFISKDETPQNPLTYFATGTQGGMHTSPFSTVQDLSTTSGPETSELKRANLRQPSNGTISVNSNLKPKPRQRTMSLVEPQSPMRPRLIVAMEPFKQLKHQLTNKNATLKDREEALETLLEAAQVYDLLGRMLRDRNSSVALERRLNAILLAEAASLSLDDKDLLHQANPGPRYTPRSGGSRRSPLYQRLSRALGLGRNQVPEGAAQWMQGDIMLAATLGGGTIPGLTAPVISPAQQRVYDELSCAYSRAAVFFAGMHPGTRWRRLAKAYAHKASQYMQSPGGQMYRSDLAQHSENLVLLQQRCGEYDAMQGNFSEATEKLRFAAWGARFLRLERAKIDSTVLELAVSFFNGDLAACNTTACELFERSTSPRNVALGARFMALCGEYEIAVQKLRSLAKLNGPLTGSNDEELTSFERGLDALGDANAWLALSLVAWRNDMNGRLAIRAAKQAADMVLCSELSDAPLPAFHIVALCFTALWDPLRDSPSPLIETLAELQELEHLLKRLLAVIRWYAVVYSVCRPHALYCVALRPLILYQARYGVQYAGASSPTHGEQARGEEQVLTTHSEIGHYSGVEDSADYEVIGGTSCFGLFGQSYYPEDPFYECAIKAREAQCYWTEGLALLEMGDTEAWIEARNLFTQYAQAEYEVDRCDRKLEALGIFAVPEGSGNGSPHPVEG